MYIMFSVAIVMPLVSDSLPVPPLTCSFSPLKTRTPRLNQYWLVVQGRDVSRSGFHLETCVAMSNLVWVTVAAPTGFAATAAVMAAGDGSSHLSSCREPLLFALPATS